MLSPPQQQAEVFLSQQFIRLWKSLGPRKKLGAENRMGTSTEPESLQGLSRRDAAAFVCTQLPPGLDLPAAGRRGAQCGRRARPSPGGCPEPRSAAPSPLPSPPPLCCRPATEAPNFPLFAARSGARSWKPGSASPPDWPVAVPPPFALKRPLREGDFSLD